MATYNQALSDRFADEMGINSLGKRRREKVIEQGSCFFDAFLVLCRLKAEGKRAYYCEGYALMHDIALPVVHAWVYCDGDYIDTTWAGVDIERTYKPLVCLSYEQLTAIEGGAANSVHHLWYDSDGFTRRTKAVFMELLGLLTKRGS